MKNRSATVFSSTLCLVSFFFAGESSASDRADFEYGMRLRKQGHTDEACKVLRELQRRNPKDANLLVELGVAYMRGYPSIKNSMEKGESCFRQAIKIDPQMGKGYALLGECFNVQGRYEEAIQMCTKALSVKYPDTDALGERSAALSSLKRDREALADIDLMMKKERKIRRRVRMQRATILENLKMYPQALAEYRTLLKDHYQDEMVMREVTCLQAMNRDDEAVKTLSALLAKSRTDDVALLMRARLYEKMGKHKEAVSDYTKALDSQPSTTALNERASVYDKIGRKDLAEKDRREAERL